MFVSGVPEGFDHRNPNLSKLIMLSCSVKDGLYCYSLHHPG